MITVKKTLFIKKGRYFSSGAVEDEGRLTVRFASSVEGEIKRNIDPDKIRGKLAISSESKT